MICKIDLAFLKAKSILQIIVHELVHLDVNTT
mgnify:CR=1 FL=1